MPDASSWKVGDEITDKVGWGNLSFESTVDEEIVPGKEWQLDYWHFVTSKGSTTRTGGLFECYDGADEDLYQYVQLPAGMYKVTCQGYYRNGTSWADDPNSFGTEDWQDNALLYVQNGTYDIESKEFTPARTFKTPLMPRLFLKQGEQLYVGPKEGEEGWPGWDMSDGNYGDKGWGPCSVPGSLIWFQAGLYAPYDDGDVKYNTTTFFLTEDGYVRLGVKKTEPKGADSFMATNFRMYYMGEAGEAAELMALQDELLEYYYAMEKIERTSSDEGRGMLGTLISDAIMGFEDEYGYIETMSKEQCETSLPIIKALYEQVVEAYNTVNNISSLMEGMETLYNSTNYAGKDEFGAAIEAAKNCLINEYEWSEEDDFDTFKTAYDNLLAARFAYLLTQEPENGAYNFSSMITNPFFCDTKYTPVWNAAANAYQFPTIEGVDEALQPENTWATIQEQGYADAKKDESRTEWIPICENVKIYEKEVENQWVIHSTTWHGGSIHIDLQHGYTAQGGWTSEPSGNPELIYQILTGLPSGYYAMSALMCNAGGEISPLQFAYIEAEGAKETAPLTQKGNPWWGGSRDQWRQTVWEKLTTNMVYVSEGKATIGVSSDAFYSTTGFQLYYYGENPDFSALLTPALAEVNAKIDGLAWEGDKAAAKAIIATIPETIAGQEAYQNALAAIAEANQYVATATAAINGWTALEDFAKLQANYEEDSDEFDILATAWLYTMGIGENETDTYKEAIASNNDYKAYASYMEALAAAKPYASKSTELAQVIAAQAETLKAEYANAAKIEELKKALAAPYNAAVLADKNAGTATEDNPIDVTQFIINPSFSEGTKAWNGSAAVNSKQNQQDFDANAESYNTDNFDVNQTIYNLPAGCYEARVKAFYRDGGIDKAFDNWVYGSAGDFDLWENKNVTLYAASNGVVRTSYVPSIASVIYNEPSFTQFIDKYEETGEFDEDDQEIWAPVYKEIDYEKLEHPFDSRIVEDEESEEAFWFPNSQLGASYYFARGDYQTSVRIMVEEGESLTIGVRKDAKVGSDWCCFDDFELYYLGTDTPVGINDITTSANAKAEYYTISGVKLNGAQKGVNIVKMSNGQVKKVFVK